MARLGAVARRAVLGLVLLAGLTTAAAQEPAPASISKRVSAAPDDASRVAADLKGRPSAAPTPDGKPGAPTERGPFAGLGLQTDHGPIDVHSDALDLDYKANQVLFKGHVRASQGTMSLNSETLKVVYAGQFHDIKQVIAQGNVRISQGGRWATGDRAILDQVERTIEMTGNPTIHDGPDQITGSRILIYLDSQKSVVEGARAVIFPRGSETRDNGAGDRGS